MKNKLFALWLFAIFILLSSCENLFLGKPKNVHIVNEILTELNRVRSNPKKYAEEELKPRLKYFDGKLYKVPGQIPLQTNEGAPAVQECIDVLMKTNPMETLALENGLCLAAQWLADDQANTGKIGHNGSDGSSPFDRMNRYGKWLIKAGENCAYGTKTGKEIVAQLLIDDGVMNRVDTAKIFSTRYLRR